MPSQVNIEAGLSLDTKEAQRSLKQLSNELRIAVNFDSPKELAVSAKIDLKSLRIDKAFEKSADLITQSLKGVAPVLSGSISEAIKVALEEVELQADTGGLFGGIANIITAPLQGISTGIFEGIGREASSKLGRGLSSGLEKQIRPLFGGFEFLGEKLLTSVVPKVATKVGESFGSSVVGQIAQSVFTDSDLTGRLQELRSNIENVATEALGEAELLTARGDSLVRESREDAEKTRRAQEQTAKNLLSSLGSQPQRDIELSQASLRLKDAEKRLRQIKKEVEAIEALEEPGRAELKALKSLAKQEAEIDQAIATLRDQVQAGSLPKEIRELSLLGVDVSPIVGIEDALQILKDKQAQSIKRIQVNVTDLQFQLKEAGSSLKELKQQREDLLKQARESLAEGDEGQAVQLISEASQVKQNIEKVKIPQREQIKSNLVSAVDLLGEIKEETQKEITSLQNRLLREEVLLIDTLTGQSQNFDSLIRTIFASRRANIAEIQEAADANASQVIGNLNALANGVESNEKKLKDVLKDLEAAKQVEGNEKEVRNLTLYSETLKRAIAAGEVAAEEVPAVVEQFELTLKELSDQADAETARIQVVQKQLQLIKEQGKITPQQLATTETTKPLPTQKAKIQQVKKVSQEAVEPQQEKAKEVESSTQEIEQSSQEIETLSQSLNNEIENVAEGVADIQNALVQAIAKSVQSISGVVLNRVPTLEIGNIPEGSSAEFDASENVIRATEELYSELAEGGQEAISLIAHELRHAIQAQSDLNKDLESLLISSTAKEFEEIKLRLSASIQNAQGGDFNTIRKLEEDAYTFQLRYTNEIVESVKQIIASTKPLQQNIAESSSEINTELDKVRATLESLTIKQIRQISQQLDVQIPTQREGSRLKKADIINDLVQGSSLEDIENTLPQFAKISEEVASAAKDLVQMSQDDIKAVLVDSLRETAKQIKESNTSLPATVSVLDEITQQEQLIFAAMSNEIEQGLKDYLKGILLNIQKQKKQARGQLTTLNAQEINNRVSSVQSQISQSVSSTFSSLRLSGVAESTIDEEIKQIKQALASNKFKPQLDNLSSETQELLASIESLQESQKDLIEKVTESQFDLNKSIGDLILDLDDSDIDIPDEGFGIEEAIEPPKQTQSDLTSRLKEIENSLRPLDVNSLVENSQEIDNAIAQMEFAAKEADKIFTESVKSIEERIRLNSKKVDESLRLMEEEFNQVELEVDRENQRETRRLQSRLARTQGEEFAPSPIEGFVQPPEGFTKQIQESFALIREDFQQFTKQQIEAQSEGIKTQAEILLNELKQRIDFVSQNQLQIPEIERSLIRNEGRSSRLVRESANATPSRRQEIVEEIELIEQMNDAYRANLAELKEQQRQTENIIEPANRLERALDGVSKAIDEEDVKSARRYNQEIVDVFKTLDQTPPDNGGNFFDSIGLGIDGLIDKIKLGGLLIGGFITGIFLDDFVANFQEFASVSIEVAATFETLGKSLAFTQDSIADSAEAFEFAKSTAKGLALDLETSIEGFTGLSAAANDTALQGQGTREVFEGISQAARVFGLNAEQSEGAFLAVSQIISKGCHGEGSLIRMSDGSTKKVEDIRVGDFLMGADGLPREVLILANGTDDLYLITPEEGDPFVVNADHKMRLIRGKERQTCVLTDYLQLEDKNHWRWVVYQKEPVAFSVKYYGEGEFFGFYISGDHLYLDAQGFEHHNTVSAEELRGQLGERIPGAFQIAARAIGVTTSELNDMLKAGEVVSDEFLPKFAQQLKLETAAGVPDALSTYNASLQSLQNNLTELQVAVGTAAIATLTPIVRTAAKAIEFLANNGELLIEIIRAVGVTVTALAIPSLIKLGTTVLPTVGKALGFAATQVGGFLGSVGNAQRRLLATEISLKSLGNLLPSVGGGFTSLGSTIASSVGNIATYTKGVVNSFSSAFSAIQSQTVSVGRSLQGLFASIGNSGTQAFSLLANQAKTSVKAIQDTFSQAGQLTSTFGASGALRGIGQDLVTNVQKSFSSLRGLDLSQALSLDAIQTNLQNVGASFQNLGNVARQSVSNIGLSFRNLGGSIRQGFSDIGGTVGQTFNGLREQSNRVATSISANFTGASEKAVAFRQQIRATAASLTAMLAPILAIQSAFLVFSTFQEIVKPIKDAEKEMVQFEKSLGAIEDELARTLAPLGEGFDELAESARRNREAIEEEISGLQKFLDKFVRSEDSLIQKANKFNIFARVLGFDDLKTQAEAVVENTQIATSESLARIGKNTEGIGNKIAELRRLSDEASSATGVNLENLTSELAGKTSATQSQIQVGIKQLEAELGKAVTAEDKQAIRDQIELLERYDELLLQVVATSKEVITVTEALERTRQAIKGIEQAEFERLNEIERAEIDGIITSEQAEKQRTEATLARIQAELKAEEDKVSALNKLGELTGEAEDERIEALAEASDAILELENNLATERINLVKAEIAEKTALREAELQEDLDRIKKRSDKLAQAQKREINALKASGAEPEQIEFAEAQNNEEAIVQQIKDAQSTLSRLNRDIMNATLPEEYRQQLREQREEVKSELLDLQGEVLDAVAQTDSTFIAEIFRPAQESTQQLFDDLKDSEEDELLRIQTLVNQRVISEEEAALRRVELSRATAEEQLKIEEFNLAELNRIREANATTFSPAQLEDIDDRIEETEDSIRGFQKTLADSFSEVFESTQKIIDAEIEKIEARFQKGMGKIEAEETRAVTEIERLVTQGAIKDEEAQKRRVNTTRKRIEAELALERQKLAEISNVEVVNTPEAFEARDQLYEQSNQRILSLEQQLASNRFEISKDGNDKIITAFASSMEEFSREYERVANEITRIEKERNLEIEKLIQQGVLSQEDAEVERLKATENRIQKELDAEISKIETLTNLPDPESIEEVRQQQQEIRQARQRTLDLQIELIQSQRQQEEALHNQILRQIERQGRVAEREIQRELKARESITEVLNRQKELLDLRASVSQSRNEVQSTITQNEIERLQGSIELVRSLRENEEKLAENRKKLNEGDLSRDDRESLRRERDELERERRSLQRRASRAGVSARTEELTLEKRIERQQAKALDQKRKALQEQQKFQLVSLQLERDQIIAQNKQVELQAKLAQIEAKRNQLKAQAELDRAEKTGNKEAIEDAKLGLDLANQEIKATSQQLALAQQNIKAQEVTFGLKEQNELLRQQSEREQLRGEIENANLNVSSGVFKPTDEAVASELRSLQEVFSVGFAQTGDVLTTQLSSALSSANIQQSQILGEINGKQINTIEELRKVNFNLENIRRMTPVKIEQRNEFRNSFTNPQDGQNLRGVREQIRDEINSIFANI